MNDKLTREEEIEFSKLKHIKCERGFFLPKEQERWNRLFDKLARRVLPALEKSMFLNEIDFNLLAN
jgi:5-formaminoimidazole-4-carboxamide-1-beta-D-ribofuranosyl 5'-monophosphate synthetase